MERLMRMRTLLLTTTALMPIALASALAGPDGGTVVGGSATISGQGSSHVIVNQSSQNAVVNWNTFNVGAGERVQFQQPNAQSATLNRVTGGLGPSQILGSIDANGRVFIVNRDGIIFGAGAVIKTSGFLATTSDIKTSDFMAGRYHFDIPGRPDASIVNMGTITAANGGFAALVAPGVRNSGTITANLGTVTLAAGNTFSLDFYGDKLITLGVNDQIAGQVKDVATGQTLKSLVTNDGKLKANGGRVELTAAAARQVVDSVINTSGVIEANAVDAKNGQIVLSAATAATKGADTPTQTVKIAGTISAAGREAGAKGGKIVVTGENIVVAGAKIDASGRAGGGTVMIGGDWAGGKRGKSQVNNQSAVLDGKAIPTATTVSVDAASVIDASAKDSGHGGKVVLWSNYKTTFAGTILALGGREFGNGGFVETSGKLIDITGNVNAGKGGMWLLDPDDLTIDSKFAIAIMAALNNGTSFLAETSAFGEGGLGDINVNASIAWSTDATLTLSAYRSLSINEGAVISNTGAGNLIVRTNNAGDFAHGTPSVAGNVFLNGSGAQVNWIGSTGSVSIYYSPLSYQSPTNFTNQEGAHVAVADSGQLKTYMLVNSVSDLQGINNNLNGTYALGKDINAASIPNFAPLGNFTGILDGHGGLGTNHTISNLTIAPTGGSTWNVGLFATTATGSEIRNLNFANVNVSASTGVTSGAQFIGVVAGQSSGNVTNVHVKSGTVDGASPSRIFAGGLVGSNQGVIAGSSASATVLGGGTADNLPRLGGLVGLNLGAIRDSFATGNVIAQNFTISGGLVGNNHGLIEGSYATGSVSGVSGNYLGGLVGINAVGGNVTSSFASGAITGESSNVVGGAFGSSVGTVSRTYSTGAVRSGAGSSVGGFVGVNAGTIAQSFATGSVTAGANSIAGGFAGGNGVLTGFSFGSITQSYATGAVTGGDGSFVAGFVAVNGGSIEQSYAAGRTIGGTNAVVGGLVASNDPASLPANWIVDLPAPVGTAPGTVTNSYWDTQTTGQSQSAGGTGLTSAQLSSGLPNGYDARVWNSNSGFYPCLTGLCANPSKPGEPVTTGQQPTNDPPQQPTPPPQDPPANQTTTPPPPPPQPTVTASIANNGPPALPSNGDGINLQTSNASSETSNNNSSTSSGSGNSGTSSNAPGNSSGGSNSAPSGPPPSATNNPNSAGRPAFTSIPTPGLGVLPSGLPLLTETRFASNEVVMQLGANLSPERIAELARSLGLEIISQHTVSLLGRTVYRFRITRGQPVRDIIVALESNGATVSAQPSYTFTLTQAEMAGRSRRGDTAQYIVAKLALAEAHGIATGKGVKIAVIDSEIDAQHPDLQGNVTSSYDALPSTDQTPHPHGTGMAGAIGSHQRLLGVAPGAHILGIRAFGVSDAGAQGTSMNIVKGLEWAVAQGAQVINMSFAGPRDPILEQAIRGLKDKGIILIAAAGNAGPKSPPLFPAADSNVIAVSATDVDDRTYRNAVRGKHVAIAAPGVDILVPAPQGGYQLTTGTSVAWSR
jgi:filamentous hemagglutinin family protein